MWLDIIKSHCYEKSFYLVGGSQDVIEKTVAKLKMEFPEMKIKNFRNGYNLDTEEKKILINDLKTVLPDVVFVALGSPRQELLIEELYQHYPCIYQGLGGSFDVYTGYACRAPGWWLRNNLEWAYRLINQPSRIKRQIHLIRFLWLLMLNRF